MTEEEQYSDCPPWEESGEPDPQQGPTPGCGLMQYNIIYNV